MVSLEVVVQECGCIALPAEINVALGIGPGSVLHVEKAGSDRMMFKRVSAAMPEEATRANAACSLP